VLVSVFVLVLVVEAVELSFVCVFFLVVSVFVESVFFVSDFVVSVVLVSDFAVSVVFGSDFVVSVVFVSDFVVSVVLVSDFVLSVVLLSDFVVSVVLVSDFVVSVVLVSDFVVSVFVVELFSVPFFSEFKFVVDEVSLIVLFASTGLGKFSQVVFILIAPSELIYSSEEEPKKPIKLYKEVKLISNLFIATLPKFFSSPLFV